MDATTTHAAGPVVSIGGRCIQRCVVCGEKLCDNLNQMAPLEEDGTPPRFCHWAEGALVQVEPGNPTRSSVVGEFVKDKLPDDFCLALVE